MSKDEYEADCDLEEWALSIAVHTTHRKIQEQRTLNSQQLVQFVSKEQMTAGLEKHMRLHILIQSAISPDTFLRNKEIERYAPVISILTKGGELELERHLIAALEVVCKDTSPKRLPVMLLKLYEDDVLCEEAIVNWWMAGEENSDENDKFTLRCIAHETKASFRAEAEPLN
eukprot:scaffold203049_cov46-Attheya_sp.AAC.4